jgi:ABC-2 type transport system ATP-binding protein
MTEPAISVQNVWKKFRLYNERSHSLKELAMGRRNRYNEFWTLKDVSFDIQQGECVGIVGSNGQGKSTLLKLIAKILWPEAGLITTHGRLSALLELGTGFHPELTGRENVFLARSLLGESEAATRARFDEIVDFSGIEEFIDIPIKNYSSGMQARLAFATTISVDPEILLIDEVLAVGDEQFQRKCSERIRQFQKDGCTIVLVSHGLSSIQELCQRSIWIKDHVIRADGRTSDILYGYLDDVEKKAAAAIEKQRETLDLVELKIEDLTYVGGDEVGGYQVGDPIVLEFTCNTTTPVNDVKIGFNIAPLHAPTTPVYSYDSPTTMRFDFVGQQRLRFSSGTNGLAPGTYLLSIGIFDQERERFLDLAPHRYRLVINASETTSGESGPTAMAATWTLSDHSASTITLPTGATSA